MKAWQGVTVLVAGLLLGAIGMRYAVPLVHNTAAEIATKPADKPDAGPGLHVAQAVQQQAGVQVAPLSGRRLAVQIDGYARALDPAPLGAIASDIGVASAAHTGSARELARLTALVAADAGASRRDLDAARAQEGQDAARLRQACLRPALEYGPGLGRLGCDSVARLAAQAARGELAVIRLDFPDGAAPPGALVQVDYGAAPVAVRVLGPAIAGDTQLQSGGVLALLPGHVAALAGVGRIVSAHLGASGGRDGVIIPRTAIVRADGAMHVYRATGPDVFERVPIESPGIKPEPLADGWFIPGNGPLKPGDRVVVGGAGTLLGLERSPGAGGGGE